ncbi:protease inhibitor I42 family protein [Faecalibacter sp. LW9]|uniref:protease inhibitor I42 family protein n=1 Tax=Faecalibacter sp. LW9 TaxID=3103144 RepID=UPI002AFF5A23|nr:protease inhibitor I42 family protein [Faecalibacter sp. LW9]
MKTMKKYILAVIALPALFSCATSKTEQKIVQLNPTEEETIVSLNVGQTVQIEAEKNPSTGYNWHLEVPSDCSVTYIKEDSKSIYNDGRVGAPIIGIYEFSASSVGECIVEFDYSRGWEGKSNQPKKVKFIVK